MMTKPYRIAKRCILALVCICSAAAAQVSHPSAFDNRSASDLLREYQVSGAGTLRGQSLLIGMLNKRLGSTNDNVKSIRTYLGKTRDPDEKVLLVKVLASMYTPRSRSQQNIDIENDLRAAIASSDLLVARQATIEYSRLAYPPDRYQVLKNARGSQVIDDDIYFGELAHGLRFSVGDQQSEMLTELEHAHNRFANEILASTFGSEANINQLPRTAQVRLLNLLSPAEPNFPLALDSFGMVDVIRFTLWLNAVALLESKLNSRTYSEVVLEHLLRAEDPRKIAAFLASPEGNRVIGGANTKELTILFRRAQAFSDSLPSNAMLRSATQTIATRLTALPPK